MEPRELLLTFIADEDKALITGKQGQFYPAQHYDINKHAKRLFKLLDENESQRFCYHYLRLGHFATVKNVQQLDILKAAYLATFDWKNQGFDKPSYDVFITLMLFGVSDTQNIEHGQATDVPAYSHYCKVAAQLNTYSSLPGVINKIHRFVPFADDVTAKRILHSLRAVNYLHHDFDGRYEQYYDVNCISFWGMIVILLINAATREQVATDMTTLPADFPQRDKHLANFHAFQHAVDTYLAQQ